MPLNAEAGYRIEFGGSMMKRLVGTLIPIAAALGCLLALVAPANAYTGFGPTQTEVQFPFYGRYGTFFLWDEGFCGNGCGPLKPIAVNTSGMYAPGPVKLSGPFYGQLGTYADSFNDRVYAVNPDAIYFKQWPGSGFSLKPQPFGPTVRATTERFYGNVKTAFADVNGDGNVDAIAVNTDGVFVKLGRADGTFGHTWRWTSSGFYGSRGTYFADVNGDRKADAIAVNASGTTVRMSTGSVFAANGPTNSALTAPSRLSFYPVIGAQGADAVWFSDSTVLVYPAGPTGFGLPQAWTTGPYYGQIESLATFGYGGDTDPVVPAAIVVNRSGIYVKYAQ